MKRHILISCFLFACFHSIGQYKGFDLFSEHTEVRLSAPFVITLDTLAEASTIKDINHRFPETWINRYLSVELTTECNGVIRQALGKSEKLTVQQLELLHAADENCVIDFLVDYVPENDLKDNPPKQIDFSLTIIPIYQAAFPGGNAKLDKYLEEHVVGQIPASEFKMMDVSCYQFTIGKDGKVGSTDVTESCTNSEMDRQIMTALRQMPAWTPARDAKGQAITQEFTFCLGQALLNGCYVY